jgi:hypothetical protein
MELFTIQTPSPALPRSTGGGRKTGRELIINKQRLPRRLRITPR